MKPIVTDVDVCADSYAQNTTAHQQLSELIEDVHERIAQREEKVRPRFEKRNQLLPRERIGLLLDPGSPFFEVSGFAGYKMHDDEDGSSAGGGMICGIGFVAGTRVMLMCSNSAIKGGSISPMGLKKSLRAQEIAIENKLPVVFLVESGGANLLYQAEIFVEGGRGFANQAKLSAMGIPQVTLVLGSSTAGGAYFPGMSDYVVMVRDRAKVFLAGPPLLKAATGEIATEEELGGAFMHASVAGTAEYLAEDDRDGIRIVREVVAAFNWEQVECHKPKAEPQEPLYPIESITGVVPVDFKTRYDVREVIARIVDGSEFLEFKAEFDPYTICGHVRINGIYCGVLGNNGPITPKGAMKATQFVQLCCQSETPLVFLQNTTGYMVGKNAEQEGMVKHGSKMLQAVACAKVPKITLIIGASFGAGNYGMCGRGFDPRFILSWPNARIGVMGGEQAAKVMSMITAAKLQRGGQPVDQEQLKLMEQQIELRMELESSALFATARLWDDGMILPEDTRKTLAFLLETCCEADARETHPLSFGVARI